MPRYVDGFLIPIPKKNLSAYRRIAAKAGTVWKEHGAVEYMECTGDDLRVTMGIPFPRRASTFPGRFSPGWGAAPWAIAASWRHHPWVIACSGQPASRQAARSASTASSAG